MCETIPHSVAFLSSALILFLLPWLVSGCNVAGFLANTANGEDTVDASYKDLHDQKCGVMVWADSGVVDDYHTVEIDTATGVQDKIDQEIKANSEEVKNATWLPAPQIAQYQQAHPGLEADAIEEVAPNLNLTRLIYVEIEAFQTHPNDSPNLSRGTMTATLTVVEVANGKGKVAFTERGITVISPRGCPPEGLPNLEDAVVYRSTLDAATSAIAKRFVQHPAEADDYEKAAEQH